MPDPNKIEGGRWDRVLRALYNLKGQGATSARISDDISPTFNFPWRLEEEFLFGERLMWGRSTTSAVAAQFGTHSLTNTSDTVLIELESITMETIPVDTFFQVQGGVIPAFATRAATPRDTRWGDGNVDIGAGTADLRNGNAAAAHAASNPVLLFPPVTRATVTMDKTIPINIVLTPGQHAVLFSLTANSVMEAVWRWREHRTEPGELAGFSPT